MVVVTHPSCLAYAIAGHPERPARVAESVRWLRHQVELTLQWADPLPVTEEILLRAHTLAHLHRLEQARDFDADTAWFADVEEHARRAVGSGLAALAHAQAGQRAFSLMRPPGHHAERERAMGFCYLNTAAIMALHARANGAARVAVFDFDVHHGNGTEAILHGQPGMEFYSIHQHPAYPGTGQFHRDNCRNYPVPPGSDREAWIKTLTRAWNDLMEGNPELIVVSAGFDAYSLDPLGSQKLEAEDFAAIGRLIHQARVPVAAILEGGYSRDLPRLIHEFLLGWEAG